MIPWYLTDAGSQSLESAIASTVDTLLAKDFTAQVSRYAGRSRLDYCKVDGGTGLGVYLSIANLTPSPWRNVSFSSKGDQEFHRKLRALAADRGRKPFRHGDCGFKFNVAEWVRRHPEFDRRTAECVESKGAEEETELEETPVIREMPEGAMGPEKGDGQSAGRLPG